MYLCIYVAIAIHGRMGMLQMYFVIVTGFEKTRLPRTNTNI